MKKAHLKTCMEFIIKESTTVKMLEEQRVNDLSLQQELML